MRQLLIRDIPDEIHEWIGQQSSGRRTSKKEFVLSVLSGAWRQGENLPLFADLETPAAPPAASGVPFKFIDLFAGIGGLRLGLERVGGRCIFGSEWDKYSQKTYRTWFGDMPEGDIRKIKPADIPDHDLLAAGFPCQPFSIAGVSKKKSLGKAHGFGEVTQGALSFQLTRRAT